MCTTFEPALGPSTTKFLIVSLILEGKLSCEWLSDEEESSYLFSMPMSVEKSKKILPTLEQMFGASGNPNKFFFPCRFDNL